MSKVKKDSELQSKRDIKITKYDVEDSDDETIKFLKTILKDAYNPLDQSVPATKLLFKEPEYVPIQKTYRTLFKEPKIVPVQKTYRTFFKEPKIVPKQKAYRTLFKEPKNVPKQKTNKTLFKEPKEFPIKNIQRNRTFCKEAKKSPNKNQLQSKRDIKITKYDVEDSDDKTIKFLKTILKDAYNPLDQSVPATKLLFKEPEYVPIQKTYRTVFKEPKIVPKQKTYRTLFKEPKNVPKQKTKKTLFKEPKEFPIKNIQRNRTLCKEAKKSPNKNQLQSKRDIKITKYDVEDSDDETIKFLKTILKDAYNPLDQSVPVTKLLFKEPEYVPIQKTYRTLFKEPTIFPKQKTYRTLFKEPKIVPKQKTYRTLFKEPKIVPKQKTYRTLFKEPKVPKQKTNKTLFKEPKEFPIKNIQKNRTLCKEAKKSPNKNQLQSKRDIKITKYDVEDSDDETIKFLKTILKDAYNPLDQSVPATKLLFKEPEYVPIQKTYRTLFKEPKIVPKQKTYRTLFKEPKIVPKQKTYRTLFKEPKIVPKQKTYRTLFKEPKIVPKQKTYRTLFKEPKIVPKQKTYRTLFKEPKIVPKQKTYRTLFKEPKIVPKQKTYRTLFKEPKIVPKQKTNKTLFEEPKEFPIKNIQRNRTFCKEAKKSPNKNLFKAPENYLNQNIKQSKDLFTLPENSPERNKEVQLFSKSVDSLNQSNNVLFKDDSVKVKALTSKFNEGDPPPKIINDIILEGVTKGTVNNGPIFEEFTKVLDLLKDSTIASSKRIPDCLSNFNIHVLDSLPLNVVTAFKEIFNSAYNRRNVDEVTSPTEALPKQENGKHDVMCVDKVSQIDNSNKENDSVGNNDTVCSVSSFEVVATIDGSHNQKISKSLICDGSKNMEPENLKLISEIRIGEFSDVEVVKVEIGDKTFNVERDEASGCDEDIVACDPDTPMFSEVETRQYINKHLKKVKKSTPPEAYNSSSNSTVNPENISVVLNPDKDRHVSKNKKLKNVSILTSTPKVQESTANLLHFSSGTCMSENKNANKNSKDLEELHSNGRNSGSKLSGILNASNATSTNVGMDSSTYKESEVTCIEAVDLLSDGKNVSAEEHSGFNAKPDKNDPDVNVDQNLSSQNDDSITNGSGTVNSKSGECYINALIQDNSSTSENNDVTSREFLADQAYEGGNEYSPPKESIEATINFRRKIDLRKTRKRTYSTDNSDQSTSINRDRKRRKKCEKNENGDVKSKDKEIQLKKSDIEKEICSVKPTGDPRDVPSCPNKTKLHNKEGKNDFKISIEMVKKKLEEIDARLSQKENQLNDIFSHNYSMMKCFDTDLSDQSEVEEQENGSDKTELFSGCENRNESKTDTNIFKQCISLSEEKDVPLSEFSGRRNWSLKKRLDYEIIDGKARFSVRSYLPTDEEAISDLPESRKDSSSNLQTSQEAPNAEIVILDVKDKEESHNQSTTSEHEMISNAMKKLFEMLSDAKKDKDAGMNGNKNSSIGKEETFIEPEKVSTNELKKTNLQTSNDPVDYVSISRDISDCETISSNIVEELPKVVNIENQNNMVATQMLSNEEIVLTDTTGSFEIPDDADLIEDYALTISDCETLISDSEQETKGSTNNLPSNDAEIDIKHKFVIIDCEKSMGTTRQSTLNEDIGITDIEDVCSVVKDKEKREEKQTASDCEIICDSEKELSEQETKGTTINLPIDDTEIEINHEVVSIDCEKVTEATPQLNLNEDISVIEDAPHTVEDKVKREENQSASDCEIINEANLYCSKNVSNDDEELTLVEHFPDVFSSKCEKTILSTATSNAEMESDGRDNSFASCNNKTSTGDCSKSILDNNRFSDTVEDFTSNETSEIPSKNLSSIKKEPLNKIKENILVKENKNSPIKVIDNVVKGSISVAISDSPSTTKRVTRSSAAKTAVGSPNCEESTSRFPTYSLRSTTAKLHEDRSESTSKLNSPENGLPTTMCPTIEERNTTPVAKQSPHRRKRRASVLNVSTTSTPVRKSRRITEIATSAEQL